MEFKIERERKNKFLRRENNSSYDSINFLVFVIRHVHCRDILLANCDIMRIIKRFLERRIEKNRNERWD